MKIRNGFVSNSSSSSFIIYGEQVKMSDIKLKENKYVAIGKDLYDATDVFEIESDEMLHSMRLSNYNFDIYQVHRSEYDPDIPTLLDISDYEYWDMSDEEINEKLSKKGAFYIWTDYASCENIEDIIQHYDLKMTKSEIKQDMIKYFRKNKLNRILDKDEN